MNRKISRKGKSEKWILSKWEIELICKLGLGFAFGIFKEILKILDLEAIKNKKENERDERGEK